ncbi:hypothetical protein PVMG_05101 [Plasmodium vivax Mauritania I]|uniref:Uncharacterized protein n=1 Tax=Plasmodium vivax Mauritania I TaxID=1035515 RepID=A0A0J9W488_PLAVI|nr:hypothetical protein PVMG_05101 [Plasmodium vivax Mauritania I]
MKFLIFINIVTFVLVSLKDHYYNNENKISISLENGDVYCIILSRRSHRILAKYENKKELMNSRFYYETRDNESNHRLVNNRDNYTYDMLKRAKPNNMETYLNGYKYRHSKKRGLKKLDCYFEKNLFTSLDKIEKNAKKKNNGKSPIISIICGKYGLPLFLLSLVPLFALVIPVYVGKVHKRGKDQCTVIFTDSSKKEVKNILHRKCTFKEVVNSNYAYIFLFISILIILLLIIYAYIKISKYLRIKEGMSK